MGKTNIQWTEETWNPTRGCSVVSPGCKHCYAMTVAGARMAHAGGPYEGLVQLVNERWVWTGDVKLVPSKLLEPVRKTGPTSYFVNSMSDVFHEALGDEERFAVFAAMAASPHHHFQILTKRPSVAIDFFENIASIAQGRVAGDQHWRRVIAWHLVKHLDKLVPPDRADRDKQIAWWRSKIETAVLRTPWPLPNVMIGVSVEDQRRADERLPLLKEIDQRGFAALTFVSFEPLLGPIVCGDVLRHVDWGIVGGESGPGARPMDTAWAEALFAEFARYGVARFMKQLGGERAKRGALEDFPERLRIRETPTTRRPRAQIERTGSARVGNRNADPKSTNDRKADADALGFELGDPVTIMAGAYRGSLGIVRWQGYSDRGGGPRIGVEVRKGADWIFIDADDAIKATSSPRFGRK